MPSEIETRFRQVTEHMNEVYGVLDIRTTRLLSITPSFPTVYGRSLDEVYADTSIWLDSVHLADRGRVAASFESHALQGEAWTEEHRVVHPDGTTRWVRDQTIPVLTDVAEP